MSNANELALLSVQGLNVYYDQIRALKDITFHVCRGEIVTLIGSNGAGKTTTLRAISRLISARAGSIRLGGSRIEAMEPHEIVRLGIAHVPEGRRIFPQLSVYDNLELGGFQLGSKSELTRRLEKCLELFPRLRERLSQLGGTLSGGEQQMLAIARALMQEPQIIMFDEPSMGLSPLFVEKVFDLIVEINRLGTTVLLVEQNASMALSIANRGYVLQTGEVTLSDTAAALLQNDAVKAAYLGEDA
ncbi:MAG: ABC transporter ATP-binding protein [Fimbriimonadaceae bacterium]|nr:ABC transporter ATP-binding protein [Alphaproteobacteria bacterium]